MAVLPSFHYQSSPAGHPGRETPYGVELLDRNGGVLHAQRLLLTDPYKDLDSARLEFFQPVPFHPSTVRLVFTCGPPGSCESKILYKIRVPRDRPSVKILCPETSGPLTGRVRVVWRASVNFWQKLFGPSTLHYLLRYSHDGGGTFRAVAPRLDTPEYEVDLDRLPGGERCQFQVLATSGIRTGMGLSRFFIVPPKTRVTAIIAPVPGTVVNLGERVELQGESYSPDAGSADPEELEWSSDLDGTLGRGHEIFASGLRGGVHTIRLGASDGQGGESSATIQIEVRGVAFIDHTSLTRSDYPERDAKELGKGGAEEKPYDGIQD